jgi:hypothetical protein
VTENIYAHGEYFVVNFCCVCQGTTGISMTSIAERARHPDELKASTDNWIVDIEYYISQQIRPVVTRLCAPIEGTDAARIADCLGLDPSKVCCISGILKLVILMNSTLMTVIDWILFYLQLSSRWY